MEIFDCRELVTNSYAAPHWLVLVFFLFTSIWSTLIECPIYLMLNRSVHFNIALWTQKVMGFCMFYSTLFWNTTSTCWLICLSYNLLSKGLPDNSAQWNLNFRKTAVLIECPKYYMGHNHAIKITSHLNLASYIFYKAMKIGFLQLLTVLSSNQHLNFLKIPITKPDLCL